MKHENTTFGPHVNNLVERINHRSNVRIAILEELKTDRGSLRRFSAHVAANCRNIAKRRKIEGRVVR